PPLLLLHSFVFFIYHPSPPEIYTLSYTTLFRSKAPSASLAAVPPVGTTCAACHVAPPSRLLPSSSPVPASVQVRYTTPLASMATQGSVSSEVPAWPGSACTATQVAPASRETKAAHC